MPRPPHRNQLPPRTSDNPKRAVAPAVDAARLAGVRQTVTYTGHPKHKANPRGYGLEPYHGERGDATLCDRDAGFDPSRMPGIGKLLRRGLDAGLVGERWLQVAPALLWTVADDGWIFEARCTNPAQADYHGYPVRPSEAIAEEVYRRFAGWAQTQTSRAVRGAAENCRRRYGFPEPRD